MVLDQYQGMSKVGYYFFFFNLFWLCWVFVAARRLSLVAASGGYCLVLLPGLLVAMASFVAEHRLSCPVACGIFLDQGLNPCPLNWQADFLPLDHQGSP